MAFQHKVNGRRNTPAIVLPAAADGRPNVNVDVVLSAIADADVGVLDRLNYKPVSVQLRLSSTD